jgi:hypothetical protein
VSEQNGKPKDAIVRPGPATIRALSKGVHREGLLEEPSAEQEVAILKAEINDLVVQLQQSRQLVQAMSAAALCFIRTLVENNLMRRGQETVVIPNAVLREMAGYSVTIAKPDAAADMTLRIRERASGVTWEQS